MDLLKERIDMDTLISILKILVFVSIIFALYYLTKSIGKWLFRRMKDFGLFILRLPMNALRTLNGLIERNLK